MFFAREAEAFREPDAAGNACLSAFTISVTCQYHLLGVQLRPVPRAAMRCRSWAAGKAVESALATPMQQAFLQPRCVERMTVSCLCLKAFALNVCLSRHPSPVHRLGPPARPSSIPKPRTPRRALSRLADACLP